MRKPPFNKKSRLLFFFAGTLVMIVVMAKTGEILKTPATPNGILDLEFAYRAAKASAVINAWAAMRPVDNIHAAIINTLLDFVFLFFYSFLLYTLCRLVAASFSGFLLITGRFVAKFALVAGLFDVLENSGMLITLNGHISDSYTLLTIIFSITKWMMALAAVLFILIAGSSLLYQKVRNLPERPV